MNHPKSLKKIYLEPNNITKVTTGFKCLPTIKAKLISLAKSNNISVSDLLEHLIFIDVAYITIGQRKIDRGIILRNKKVYKENLKISKVNKKKQSEQMLQELTK